MDETAMFEKIASSQDLRLRKMKMWKISSVRGEILVEAAFRLEEFIVSFGLGAQQFIALIQRMNENRNEEEMKLDLSISVIQISRQM